METNPFWIHLFITLSVGQSADQLMLNAAAQLQPLSTCNHGCKESVFNVLFNVLFLVLDFPLGAPNTLLNM